ncbi:TrmH family RNA methyltransferase [Candidatus Nesciobacter abundans]|uniref:RNA methyltransferase n=1 Tax=Candidatus Nesciobacter abundans TaxID=2601668 RepID=A0A5C0UHD4_9PROT|nr:RNA methyltransferase [Candidatus Nesciobacter abundans]QEK39081.1 RNA methyltransferase [Candidatus Nesciobacter abundans]
MRTIRIWGRHAVFSALSNKQRQVESIICIKKYAEEVKQIRRVSIKIVDRRHLDDILPGVQHQGILLMCSSLNTCKLSTCDHINPDDNILALDQLQDPQNIGAIMRSMAAFNFKHLLVTKDRCPELDGVAAKASCGGIDRVHILKAVNLADSLIRLKKNGFWCFGLEGNEKDEYKKYSGNITKGVVLVVGSEGFGIRDRIKSECDGFISIDTNPEFPVLNASVAASLGMHIINNGDKYVPKKLEKDTSCL